MLEEYKTRLIIDINDLREFDPKFTETFLSTPFNYLAGFNKALDDVVADKFNHEDVKTQIGFIGNFGKYFVTPRQLLSNMIGRLVCVEGIITKSTIILPKLVESVHYCPETNKFLTKNYRDLTSMDGTPTGYTLPRNDKDGNTLETEYGLSSYKDTQTIFIQEMPERAPAGQLPRSVECLLEDELVDSVKPGDRIRIIGVYRALAGKVQGSNSGIMKTVLIANNVQMVGHQIQSPVMSAEDVVEIKKLSNENNVIDILSKSIAPSIYGHETIKKSLLLLLFGGMEKTISKTHLRGDLNILLVGDPSTAKSQLLRFMMNISPLSISTTGRASTGVGLTAAVVQDKQTGQRTLQAGAMVLADRGIVCVDEFDKMNDIDRVAMHEVMEQQTVTIAKAGVQTTLNARCSVIAAANPIFGQYNREISIQKNIGLPDSLLSRFDLVFIVLDKHDSVLDREIADHVLNIHRSQSKDIQDNVKSLVSQELHDTKENDEKSEERYHIFKNEKVYSTEFLRKYIFYMKYRIQPELTTEASNLISEKYCDLRKSNTQKTLPVTPRTLEALIRLATAHAKCRMSNEVSVDDVEAVIKILEYALYFTDNNQSTTSEKKIVKGSTKKRKRDEEEIIEDQMEEETISLQQTIDKIIPEEKKQKSSSDELKEKTETIRKQLIQMIRDTRKDAIEIIDFHEFLNNQQEISMEELMKHLEILADEDN
eukprot:gene9309-1397_t